MNPHQFCGFLVDCHTMLMTQDVKSWFVRLCYISHVNHEADQAHFSCGTHGGEHVVLARQGDYKNVNVLACFARRQVECHAFPPEPVDDFLFDLLRYHL